jgi:hypothetical protein
LIWRRLKGDNRSDGLALVMNNTSKKDTSFYKSNSNNIDQGVESSTNKGPLLSRHKKTHTAANLVVDRKNHLGVEAN